MNKHLVSIVPYVKPLESVRKAVELSQGLEQLPSNARVFIKPNIVFWTKAVAFPKWGVITTSRVVEDMIILLKERGIDDITIAEGTVTMNPKDFETPAHAFEMLGYGTLKKKYGEPAPAPAAPTKKEDRVEPLPRADQPAPVSPEKDRKARIAELNKEQERLRSRIKSLKNPFLPRVPLTDEEKKAEEGKGSDERVRMLEKLLAGIGEELKQLQVSGRTP